MIGPTIEMERAAGTTWDVVVVGAGPSGALAARQCARSGFSVLLVDKSRFPRYKVCGCCINPRARHALTLAGLDPLLNELRAVPLSAFHVVHRGKIARLSLPAGYVSLSRESFDAALVREAITAGAHFLPETRARLGAHDENTRQVLVTPRSMIGTAPRTECSIRAKLVLAADGLSSSIMGSTVTNAHSRVGIGAVIGAERAEVAHGVTHMACGRHGYLGFQRLEDGRLDLAAAVDARWLRQVGGPSAAAACLLEESGIVGLDVHDASWKGTPPLTQRPTHTSLPRVLALGDAGGYVEPFTGEGLAWALNAAVAVAPIVAGTAIHGDATVERVWQEYHRELVTRRQWICKAMAAGLRRPSLVAMGVRAVAAMPLLARPLMWEINRSASREAASPFSV